MKPVLERLLLNDKKCDILSGAKDLMNDKELPGTCEHEKGLSLEDGTDAIFMENGSVITYKTGPKVEPIKSFSDPNATPGTQAE